MYSLIRKLKRSIRTAYIGTIYIVSMAGVRLLIWILGVLYKVTEWEIEILNEDTEKVLSKFESSRGKYDDMVSENESDIAALKAISGLLKVVKNKLE